MAQKTKQQVIRRIREAQKHVKNAQNVISASDPFDLTALTDELAKARQTLQDALKAAA